MDNKVPRINYPHLFSFVKTKNISVNFARNAGPETLLHLPLSPLAAAQLIELAQDLNSLPIIEEQDIWSYIWGSPFFLHFQSLYPFNWPHANASFLSVVMEGFLSE